MLLISLFLPFFEKNDESELYRRSDTFKECVNQMLDTKRNGGFKFDK